MPVEASQIATRDGNARHSRRCIDQLRAEDVSMQAQSNRGLILVAEDEWVIAEAIMRALSDLGIEVLGPATTIAQAWTLLKLEAPVAVTRDMRLSKDAGLLVMDALLQSGVAFTFLTGRRPEDLACGYEQCRILSKPFSELALEAEVLALLKLPAAPRGDVSSPPTAEFTPKLVISVTSDSDFAAATPIGPINTDRRSEVGAGAARTR